MFALAGASLTTFPIRLAVESEKLALAWRLDFYGFRNAMRREGDARVAVLDRLRIRLEGRVIVVEDAAKSGVGAEAVVSAIMTALRPNEAPKVVQAQESPSGFEMDAVSVYLRGGK
jgi:hypothetical protein